MNPQLLELLGLTKSQVKVYLALVEKGELTPPEVASITDESRTNAYMIMQRLESIGLIERVKESKKLSYRPNNPIALERLAEERRAASTEAEQQIKQNMPQMLSYFYSFTEKPGIRLLQGLEGLKEIYEDALRTKEDVYFLRTTADVKFMGEEFFQEYKKRRAKLGITTYAFTTGPATLKRSYDDKINKMLRTWLSEDDYTAPVEVHVYGSKVAFMVYGEEIMGVIIQSQSIADSMRQMFNMIKPSKRRK